MTEETEKKISMVAYIDCRVDHPGQGFVAQGLHGYYVTDTPVKRGYGLKNILPSPLGYVKGDAKDLTEVDRVFDGSYVNETTPQLTNVVTGLIVQATAVLEMALSELEKDVDLVGVSIHLNRVNLATQMQSKFAKLVQKKFTDSQGNRTPYEHQILAFNRAFEVLTEKKVTITVTHVEVTDMGYVLAKIMSDSGQLNGVARLKKKPFSDHLLSIVDPRGYWNHEHGRHPLLSHSRLIFWSNVGVTKLPEYLWTMDYQKTNDVKKDKHKLEIEVGQLLPDCRYAVVKPHVHDTLLDDVVNKHCQYHKETNNNLAVLYLSAIYSKKGHAYLERFGTDYLLSNTFLTELHDGVGNMFSHDMPIPRRSRRAAEVYAKLQETLCLFENALGEEPVFSFEGPLGIMVATEFTDAISTFTENTKGARKYKPSSAIEIPNTVLKVPAFYDDPEKVNEKVACTVMFSIGYDLPTRNTIAGLLGDKFRAFVVVYRDMDYCRRHATVIVSELGCGIWATPFAAPTFLR